MDIISVLKTLFLGFIEGLTEFLSTSSTDHLVLFGYLINFYSDSGSLGNCHSTRRNPGRLLALQENLLIYYNISYQVLTIREVLL